MNSNFSLGKRLRQLRLDRGLSQEQVANNANITSAYFGQVERGTKNVTVGTLEKICFALNISLAEFFNVAANKPNDDIDDISFQILHQLNNKSNEDKQIALQIIKLFFSQR